MCKTPPTPEIVGGEERYKVEEVVDSRFYHRRLQFLVRWKGYGHEENLWLVEGDVNAPDLIAEFYRAHLNAPKCISTLAFRQLRFRLRNRMCGKKGGFVHRDAVP
jgi:S-methylmethionine-dependent homocysteine/selenocysteine methylase